MDVGGGGVDIGVVTRARVSKLRRLQEYVRRKNAMRATNDVCPFTQDTIPPAESFVLVEEPRPGRSGPGTVYRFHAKHLDAWVRIKEVNPFTNTPLKPVEMGRLRRMRSNEDDAARRHGAERDNREVLAFFDGDLGRIAEEYMAFAEQDCFEFCEARMRQYTLPALVVNVRQFAQVDAEACIRSLDHAVTVCMGPPNYRRSALDLRSIELIVGMLLRLKGALVPLDEDEDDDDEDQEDDDEDQEDDGDVVV